MNEEEEEEDKIILRSHHDADGICSSYLTSFHLDEPYEIELWDGTFGDTTGLKAGDWMCDMHPLQPLKGLNVVDHHGVYPLTHNYNLIYGSEPASLLAYQAFKDDIPKSEWWKVAIGLVGDGQPELIPSEIYKECPQLLNWTKTSAYKKFNWTMAYYPMYKLISSPINAFLRKSDFRNALRLIHEAKTPKDIISDIKSKSAKAEVRTEFDSIVKGCESLKFQNVVVFIFYSKFRMSGYVASALQDSVGGKTIIAINKKTNRGSVRGDLACYWRDRLKELDYVTIDGHPGFMGCSINKNAEVFIDDITEMLQ